MPMAKQLAAERAMKAGGAAMEAKPKAANAMKAMETKSKKTDGIRLKADEDEDDDERGRGRR